MKNYEDKLNEVVRGERSAVETYNQILEKFRGETEVDSISTMKNDHHTAVTNLESKLRATGTEPSQDSGAWGGVAKTVMGTAKLFGDKSALKALKEGEEHGKKLYNELLECDGLPNDIEELVKGQLLPNQQQHIQKIDQLMNRA
ncbi:MAG: hypothetical protein CME64_07285 [Halobacteriovoraceae bacterium]|nr:hypothetical protein [Halobacteriovoraceae bacterium]|tara:strand:+ start:10473 stop:10904 length:432 start_codon:yes stop_codon:yes gene_type:complete